MTQRWTVSQLLILLVAIGSISYAQNRSTVQPGLSNIAGTLYASNFGQWVVPQGIGPAAGTINWGSPSVCKVTSAGGNVTFDAFAVGTQITINDANPAHNEVVTVTKYTSTAYGCSITASMQYTHYSYHLTTATGGLQEAINWAMPNSYVVYVTPDFTRLGGTNSTITSAIGGYPVSIMDARVSAYVPYVWNGTAYVADPFVGIQAMPSATQTITQPLGTSLTVTNPAYWGLTYHSPIQGIVNSASPASIYGIIFPAQYGTNYDGIAGAINCASGSPPAMLSGVRTILGTTPTDGTYNVFANSGTGAATIVVTGGIVVSQTVTNAGSYTTPPTFTAPAGLGTGALIYPLISGPFPSTVSPSSLLNNVQYQCDGGGFYVSNASMYANSVGVFGTAINEQNGGKVWGANFVDLDDNVHGNGPAYQMYGVEIDNQPYYPFAAYRDDSAVLGIWNTIYAPNPGTTKNLGYAYTALSALEGSGGGKWTAAYNSNPGAAVYALLAGEQSNTAPSPSQLLTFYHSNSSNNTRMQSFIGGTTDGNLTLTAPTNNLTGLPNGGIVAINGRGLGVTNGFLAAANLNIFSTSATQNGITSGLNIASGGSSLYAYKAYTSGARQWDSDFVFAAGSSGNAIWVQQQAMTANSQSMTIRIDGTDGSNNLLSNNLFTAATTGVFTLSTPYGTLFTAGDVTLGSGKVAADHFVAGSSTNTSVFGPISATSVTVAGEAAGCAQWSGSGVLQSTATPCGVPSPVTTVSALPSASTNSGKQYIVTDATTFTVGACTGGGSDTMIAVSNGTAWSCH